MSDCNFWNEDNVMDALMQFGYKIAMQRGIGITEFMKEFKQSKTQSVNFKIPPSFKEAFEKYGDQQQSKNNQDWEILERFNYNEGAFDGDIAPIKSVKVLSSGEIFSVDDKVLLIQHPQYQQEYVGECTISGFSIREEKMYAFGHDKNNHSFTWWLSKVEKAKPILFTTEDNVAIYEHDIYHSVNKEFRLSGRSNGLAWYNPETGEKYFSTEDAAKEYILMNKPCLSILEVERMMSLNIVDGCPHKHSKHIHGTTTTNSLKELVKQKINQ